MDDDSPGSDVALVTGAASGIGRAIATRLAEEYVVYATDIDTDGLVDLSGSGCRTCELDVTDPESIDAVHSEIATTHGGVDVLVNNAGYGELGPLEDLPVEAVREQFDVNVHGPLRLCQAVLPDLRERGGRIVNVASVLGRVAAPGTGAYSASKFALEGLSDALRRELDGSGVEVVLVEPAWVETDFAAASRERIGARQQDSTYEGIYHALMHTSALDGGALAVPPARVADVVSDAVTATDPATRYSVGWQARVINWMTILPDRVVDALLATVVDNSTLLGRE